MLNEIECSGRPLGEKDIANLERLVGHQLPDAYKHFLLKNNGGRPTPEVYPVEGFEEGEGDIHTLLGIDVGGESSDLAWHFEVLKGRIPSNLLPIAYSNCGDIICLSLYGEDAGGVFFWDHEDEHAPPTYENVYRIAGSFQEFLDSLYEPSD